MPALGNMFSFPEEAEEKMVNWVLEHDGPIRTTDDKGVHNKEPNSGRSKSAQKSD